MSSATPKNTFSVHRSREEPAKVFLLLQLEFRSDQLRHCLRRERETHICNENDTDSHGADVPVDGVVYLCQTTDDGTAFSCASPTNVSVPLGAHERSFVPVGSTFPREPFRFTINAAEPLLTTASVEKRRARPACRLWNEMDSNDLVERDRARAELSVPFLHLNAVLRSLRLLKIASAKWPAGVRPDTIPVRIDCRFSAYLSSNLDASRLVRWRKNGWKTLQGTQISNADLWRELVRWQTSPYGMCSITKL